jgi:hypothetical protein
MKHEQFAGILKPSRSLRPCKDAEINLEKKELLLE